MSEIKNPTNMHSEELATLNAAPRRIIIRCYEDAEICHLPNTYDEKEQHLVQHFQINGRFIFIMDNVMDDLLPRPSGELSLPCGVNSYAAGRSTLLAQLKEAAKGLMTTSEIEYAKIPPRYTRKIQNHNTSVQRIRAIAEGRE